MSLNSQKGGKSGAFVFTTFDGKLVLKTITKYEKNTFLKEIAKKYIARVVGNANSSLARILGIFKSISSGTCFMLMECVNSDQECSVVFDIKGSDFNRFVEGVQDPGNPPCGMVLKDQNFQLYGGKIDLETFDRENVLLSIEEDVEFLRKLEIMDYSLLIVFYQKDNIWTNRYTKKLVSGGAISIGIIDICQKYTVFKAGESTFKSIFHNSKKISSMSPDDYAYRFLQYIRKIFENEYED